ncbi:MAG: ECF transporter S component [Muribaculaceae bacterium]|nr:ECF transporter S component [Muribaculaceae bacterium]
MTTSVKLYSLDFSAIRTYLIALAFVAGNIVLPQLCHTMHMGGPTWLPIYFFTLLAAYKYGFAAGLFTALASPAANCLLFGMPAAAALPAILIKSVLLAGIAAFTARRSGRVSLMLLTAVILGYQMTGTLFEWALKSDFYLAAQDFRIGIPGMLVQLFCGWAMLKYVLRK